MERSQYFGNPITTTLNVLTALQTELSITRTRGGPGSPYSQDGMLFTGSDVCPREAGAEADKGREAGAEAN